MRLKHVRTGARAREMDYIVSASGRQKLKRIAFDIVNL